MQIQALIKTVVLFFPNQLINAINLELEINEIDLQFGAEYFNYLSYRKIMKQREKNCIVTSEIFNWKYIFYSIIFFFLI